MSLTKVQSAMIGGGTGSTAFAPGTPVYENTQTISANYTIPTGSSAMSVGPITIASGVTVTIALSGDSIPNIMFGVYQLDTTKFRTYNAVFDMSIPAFEMKYTKKTNTIDPMPNLVTTVENIFYTRKKTKGLAGITLLGYAQPKEFEKTYAWIFYKGSKDLTKLFTFKHDGKAYPIDSLRTTGRKALKLKKAIKASRSKYNNIAFEQGVLFNLNLYASEYGVKI